MRTVFGTTFSTHVYVLTVQGSYLLQTLVREMEVVVGPSGPIGAK